MTVTFSRPLIYKYNTDFTIIIIFSVPLANSLPNFSFTSINQSIHCQYMKIKVK